MYSATFLAFNHPLQDADNVTKWIYPNLVWTKYIITFKRTQENTISAILIPIKDQSDSEVGIQKKKFTLSISEQRGEAQILTIKSE